MYITHQCKIMVHIKKKNFIVYLTIGLLIDGEAIELGVEGPLANSEWGGLTSPMVDEEALLSLRNRGLGES